MNNNLLLAVLAIISIAVGIYFGSEGQKQVNPYAHVGGEFELNSINGPVKLSDYKGKAVVIYFGYTSCPDVCITSLTALGAAMKLLNHDEITQVQPLFITIDPERDTVERIDEYARYFHPAIVGLVGSMEQTAELAKKYMMIYAKVDMEDSAMGYSMDHSSTLYVINRDNETVALVRHGETPSAIAESIRSALND